MGLDIVEILVQNGKEKTKLAVHKTRICGVSSFFDKAFKGNSKEAAEDRILLKDVDITIVVSFTEWLYQNAVLTFPEDSKMKIDHLIDVYLFADQVRCNGLKNHIMDKIQDELFEEELFDDMGDRVCPTKKLSTQNIRKVFENTLSTKDTPIRKFCAALIAFWIFNNGSPEKVQGAFAVDGFLKEFGDFQRELNTDIFWATYGACCGRPTGIRTKDDPRIRGQNDTFQFDCVFKVGYPVCHFHVHKKGENCESVVHPKANRRCNCMLCGGDCYMLN